MLSDVGGGGGGVSECAGRPILILLTKIGYSPWPGIMLIIYY